MKFVSQTCQEGKLPNFDTQVETKSQQDHYILYRKLTSTGVLMNFNLYDSKTEKFSKFDSKGLQNIFNPFICRSINNI